MIDATAGGTGPTIVDCGLNSHATGGGAVQRGTFVVADHLISSFPSLANGTPVTDGTTNPRYWTSRYEPHEGGTLDGWNVFAIVYAEPALNGSRTVTGSRPTVPGVGFWKMHELGSLATVILASGWVSHNAARAVA